MKRQTVAKNIFAYVAHLLFASTRKGRRIKDLYPLEREVILWGLSGWKDLTKERSRAHGLPLLQGRAGAVPLDQLSRRFWVLSQMVKHPKGWPPLTNTSDISAGCMGRKESLEVGLEDLQWSLPTPVIL